MEVMQHVVRVESSYNPYAIGVVGGRLVRQPRNLAEALSTVAMLERRGYNFSVGLAQVNRYNLAKYGVASYERAFEPCANLQAGSRILSECYYRSSGDWGKSFSCYYSGDFVTGYRHGYVQKIYASMRAGAAVNARLAIPVVANAATAAVRAQDAPPRAIARRLPNDSATPTTASTLSADPADVFAGRATSISDRVTADARRMLTATAADASAVNRTEIPGSNGRYPIIQSAPGSDLPAAAPANTNQVVHLADLQHVSGRAPASGTPVIGAVHSDAAFVF